MHKLECIVIKICGPILTILIMKKNLPITLELLVKLFANLCSSSMAFTQG